MHKHWDYILGSVTTLATFIASRIKDLAEWKEALIFGGAFITILILSVRLFILCVSAWQKWRDRHQPWKPDKE